MTGRTLGKTDIIQEGDEVWVGIGDWSKLPEIYWGKLLGAFPETWKFRRPLSTLRASKLPDSNPKTAHGCKKVPMHLVPPIVIASLAMAWKSGAEKYGPYNWREPGAGISSSTYYAACLRHLSAWWDGEDNDPDNKKVSHLAHAAACLGMLIDAGSIPGQLNDDRPPKGAVSGFLEGNRLEASTQQTPAG